MTQKQISQLFADIEKKLSRAELLTDIISRNLQQDCKKAA